MFRLIYMGVVGFLLIVGFLNLDDNDWQPVELPSFLLTGFEERVLPFEEWEKTMIGAWKFTETNRFYDGDSFKGTVIYNSDNSFVRKVIYFYKNEEAVGVVEGKWETTNNNIWIEITKECIFAYDDYMLCSLHYGLDMSGIDTLSYGAIEEDLWDYNIVRFNNSKIEIRAKELGSEHQRVFKLIKEK